MSSPSSPLPSYPHPIIAREGWPFIGIALALALLVNSAAGWFLALPFWLVFLLLLSFFRDPPRAIPSDERSILSPADGRVIAIERAHDPYLDRDSLKISISLNLFNAHSIRSPADGEVKQLWHHPGRGLKAALDKASSENERNAMWLRTTDGTDITCVQIAGLSARRILCDPRAGASLQRGERYGFIRFDARVDLYLPVGSKARITLGDKVLASASIIAELP
ncbi:phosphatidylserine decarboxylase [Denitromonas iodatirespirans]|uniref:Phosphatidylserine decarboxylase proenzyme n=1 Tax=Denitromonas iodatirespirans TaxID=2795389 RepID=A0A944D8D4_DENI1|nr:phosphatidylserine decarboxylase [Denitromonas iodatirespirans]MBT0960406.1 phosphatidylserine decarboxylase [Denitromonas iodatirespirans]